jgi:hypothetical protein
MALLWTRSMIGVNHALLSGDQAVRTKPENNLFIALGVPRNIADASDNPARMPMTESPSGREHCFKELATLAANGSQPAVAPRVQLLLADDEGVQNP